MKAENPGASFGELNKIMGEKWKTISDERKAKYVEQAAELKKEFDAKEVRGQGSAVGDGDAGCAICGGWGAQPTAQVHRVDVCGGGAGVLNWVGGACGSSWTGSAPCCQPLCI